MSLGMSVMIRELMDKLTDKKPNDATTEAIGREIQVVKCDEDTLKLFFTDGSILRIVDEGQSCCESRYMTTDDDLSVFAGATYQGAEIRDAPNMPDGEEHEVAFLIITTSRGSFTVETHNEHNGYYGGFLICAALEQGETNGTKEAR